MRQGLGLGLVAACMASACSDPLQLGSDLLWSADQESGNLEPWTREGSGEALTPRTPDSEDTPVVPGKDSAISVTTEAAHRGGHALKLVNPTGWEFDDQGPELFHALGELHDAYYSAWFLLPEDYRLEPHLTLLRLRSRDFGAAEPFNGEELQLRSLSSGGYVLQVFNNNNGFLLEPIANPAPFVHAGRWFQLEARYEPQSSGRLRVWLDGGLVYDLSGRPGALGAEMVLGVCNVAQDAEPAPLILYVDDVAASLSRVSPSGVLSPPG
jgi:hypothetical protein